MKDFVRILLFLGAFSVGGVVLSYATAFANGWAFDWSWVPLEIAFGMVIGGAVLWPYLAWQEQVDREAAGIENPA